jgi:hypothetical protein
VHEGRAIGTTTKELPRMSTSSPINYDLMN